MILKHPFSPSFPLAEERVVERSNDRVSKYTRGIALLHRRTSTHPDYATLVDPLFACGGKRVKTDGAITCRFFDFLLEAFNS